MTISNEFTERRSAELTATNHGRAFELLQQNRLGECIKELTAVIEKNHDLPDEEIVSVVIATIYDWRNPE